MSRKLAFGIGTALCVTPLCSGPDDSDGYRNRDYSVPSSDSDPLSKKEAIGSILLSKI